MNGKTKYTRARLQPLQTKKKNNNVLPSSNMDSFCGETFSVLYISSIAALGTCTLHTYTTHRKQTKWKIEFLFTFMILLTQFQYFIWLSFTVSIYSLSSASVSVSLSL